MKHFPKLSTRQLSVQLKELSISDAITIAGFPDHLYQAECTAFLRAAINNVSHGQADPSNWTIQERALAIAHYLAVVAEDGPDFSLGEGRYSDYLDVDLDAHEISTVELGEIGDDLWEMRHLTGAMAESIERLVGQIQIAPRLHWLIGAMAAQLIRKSGEELPDTSTDDLLDEWLLFRIKVLMEFPESDFERLLNAYYIGREKLHHLFAFIFDDTGIVFLPKEGGLDGALPPARFSVCSCLSRLAIDLAGKPGTFSAQS